MFYKKEEIDAALRCFICSGILVDPRTLPCNESACHECIRKMSNADNEFDCSFCSIKHKPAGSGEYFPPNSALNKLLKAKAGEVYRNENVNNLRLKLDEINRYYEE
jgi:hypothetical protein